MPLTTPDFWRKNGITAKALLPAAALYQLGYRARRAFTTPASLAPKLLCVGNLVAGGAGKTPVALALGEYLKAQGKRACYLSKGYGGRIRKPTLVDTAAHTARDVGDEPLLLARVLPTFVARDRAAGAKEAERRGYDYIILDDGFQNPALKPDFALVVADGVYGFGNGYTLPAGPLREPVESGLARADALVVIRRDRKQTPRLTHYPVPTLAADLRTSCPEQAQGQKVVAFAGIARPTQFFEALVQHCGLHVIGSHAYSDHHAYRQAELDALLAEAHKHGAKLVTTAKDAVRLPPALLNEVLVAEAAINWHNADALHELLAPLLAQENPS